MKYATYPILPTRPILAMKPIMLFFLMACMAFTTARAGRISGTVTDDKGALLAYSSVFVKGTTKGVTANNEGKYSLELDPGNYTLVCQYVGYTRQEKKISVEAGQGTSVVDFRLSLQQLSLGEVVVRPGGEDPAYEIIRHAIKKRKDYEFPLDSFTCEAYIKTLAKTRGLPGRILGQKITGNDKKDAGLDSAGKGIIFLSESLTKIAYKKPGKVKLEVLSGRQSGSNGYGFSFPTFINFYNNNVTVLGSELNPRGFISPIAESALHYYKYKYLGSFFEDGKEINKIQVIPRRKYEPLFTGTINIMEGEWRIHSLDLTLLKESQLEILDTLQIRQIQVPVGGGVWQTKDQVVYFAFKLLGIDMVGNFLDVFSKYETAPQFRKKFFNNVLVRYDTAVNKKTKAYWDSIRPLPLEPEEKQDYKIRDSIYESTLDSAGSRRNRDTLLRHQGHIKVLQVLESGFSRSDFNPAGAFRYSMQGLLPNLEYNTVEGVNLSVIGSLSRTLRPGGPVISFSPNIRYGFSNGHLNAWGMLEWSKRSVVMEGDDLSSTRQTWALSGGRRVSQFNPDNPISETLNGLYTLLARRNYMKIYENSFAEISSIRRLDNGLRISANVRYEDRSPLENTTDYSLIKVKNRSFTPNYPFEQLPAQFPRHQALLTGVSLEFQPGQRYIEFPHRKISIGSKYPILDLDYQKGWHGALGSDVDFDKWQFSVRDNINFKLKGLLRYRFSFGGFLNTRSVFIQDYQHFNGNQVIFASQFLNSFQLAPYYANSTTAAFYATGHVEHHFNGLLTNKIPLFRRLNWYLVGGSNAFYVKKDNNYVEVFGGLENIFKIFRVDVIGSYYNGHKGQVGFRIGLGGLLGNGFLSGRR